MVFKANEVTSDEDEDENDEKGDEVDIYVKNIRRYETIAKKEKGS